MSQSVKVNYPPSHPRLIFPGDSSQGNPGNDKWQEVLFLTKVIEHDEELVNVKCFELDVLTKLNFPQGESHLKNKVLH